MYNITSSFDIKAVEYRKQILLESSLSPEEKNSALLALEQIIQQFRDGEIIDLELEKLKLK